METRGLERRHQRGETTRDSINEETTRDGINEERPGHGNACMGCMTEAHGMHMLYGLETPLALGLMPSVRSFVTHKALHSTCSSYRSQIMFHFSDTMINQQDISQHVRL